jgi:hypothetical protein
MECIRQRDQRLNARVPVLLFCGVHQLLTLQVRIVLYPLLRFDYLERVRACRKHLAQQRIGI